MVRRSIAHEFVVASLFAAVVGLSGVTEAAPSPTEAELAHAREEFGAARRLENTGQWAEALAALRRVASVKTTPQVRFHIALCLESVGLWTQALDGYARAATEAIGVAPEVVKEAEEHLRQLAATMPTVSIHVQGAALGDELFLDGRRFPAEEQPLPIRADPGAHTAEVRRTGAVVARGHFTLEAQKTRWVELSVGSIALGERTPAKATVAPATSDPGGVQRFFGWSTAGLGVASAVAAGVFIARRADALGRLDAICSSHSICPPSTRPLLDPIVREGTLDATLVNLFSAVAAGSVATSILLFSTAKSRPGGSERSTLEVRARLLGFSVGGAF